MLAVCLLLLAPALGGAISVVPKLDFEDTSPGIAPDHSKAYTEKEVRVGPGVVKAVVEVKVGEGIVTTKQDKKKDEDTKNTKILICDAWGDCKLHEVRTAEKDDDEDEEEEDDKKKKKLKPVIVTDFDKDPLADEKDDDDDDGGKKKPGKKYPKVPVIVGYKGAVTDDGFPYTGPGDVYGPGFDDYGHVNNPGVHHHGDGPGLHDYDHGQGHIYGDDSYGQGHRYGEGGYGQGHRYGADGYGQGHRYGSGGYGQASWEGYGQKVDRIPVYYGLKLSPEFHQPYPGLVIDEEASRPYNGAYLHGGGYPEPEPFYPHVIPQQHPYFAGRTPTPYGKFYPTRRPDSFHAIITPLGRKTGVHWPSEVPVAVVGKMDFPEDDLVSPTEPSRVKIDGKLGEPLAKAEKE